MIFLFGPPGVGKTTFGRRACEELGLEFLDPTEGPSSATARGPVVMGASDPERLRGLIDARPADVMEVPWSLQSERKVLQLARKSGISVLLWAHPEDMRARSRRPSEGVLTPVPRLSTRGGFGRTGAGCREFRQLGRGCTETLMLVNLSFDAAAREVTACISGLLETSCISPIEREGLQGWVEEWCRGCDARPAVAEVMATAMARYLSHLRSSGKSPRTLAGISSDLEAAGHLVLMFDAPKDGGVLRRFDSPPWELEFARKFSDSPSLRARYSRSLEGFARFLRDHDELSSED